MASPTLPNFSGPLTAIAVNEWLVACEKKFESWDAQNPSSKLSDLQKVQGAGDRISSEGDTNDLSDWWNETSDITTWADFKERVKEEILGSDWRARALEAFYTSKQGNRTIDKYMKSLDEVRSVIKHAAKGESKMKEVDDFTFKCFMIFNADPALAAKIMDDAGFDIISATVNAAKQRLRKLAPSVAAASPMRSLGGICGYILLDQWGNTSNGFTDLGNLPQEARNLGATKSVTIWSNGLTARYMIQRYQIISGSVTLVNATANHLNDSRTLDLANGEHIASVAITTTHYQARSSNYSYNDSGIWSVSSMTISTSATPPRSISLGTPHANAKSSYSPQSMHFTAPNGWRIVGFRGVTGGYYDYYDISGNYVYPIVGLGAILAPVTA